MKKQFTLLQLFSLVDGRLSTEIGDVYIMLNHICDDNLMTHHLPVAIGYLKSKRPDWFIHCEVRINTLKRVNGDRFETLIKAVEKYNEWVEVPQLEDEFDTSDFHQYMLDNSLLLKKLEA